MIEWEEWGDPLHDPEVYAYMKSYTPYENVAAIDYPRHPGHHEPQRHPAFSTSSQPSGWPLCGISPTNSDKRPILLKTEMVGRATAA